MQIVYCNDSGDGVGSLLIDGKAIKGLVKVKIVAKTKTDKVSPPVRVEVTRYVGEELRHETMEELCKSKLSE